VVVINCEENKHPKKPLMSPAYVNSLDFSFFCDTKQQLNTMIAHLSSDSQLAQEHAAIEQYIRDEGHELLRRLLRAHLEVRASQENKQDTIVNLEDKHLTHCRYNTKATLTSLFGDVNVIRKGGTVSEKSPVNIP
jgi:hypothetical protein